MDEKDYKFSVIPPELFLSVSPLIRESVSRSGMLLGSRFILVISSSIPSGPDISLLAGLVGL